MDHYGELLLVTARKTHTCSWCSERIPKGSQYVSRFTVCDGDAWTMKMHPECSKAESSYDYDGDTLDFPQQFQRGHTHESNYYSTLLEGLAEGCPGCQRELEEVAA